MSLRWFCEPVEILNHDITYGCKHWTEQEILQDRG